MASDIEQRNFVDKNGLEQFWDDIQAYMTRMYKGLPAGMHFSRSSLIRLVICRKEQSVSSHLPGASLLFLN